MTTGSFTADITAIRRQARHADGIVDLLGA
jgi:hypothetical protein